MNKALEKLLKKANRARAGFQRAVYAEQRSCEHREVEECDYRPFQGGGALPPMRVCCNCGMTEDGWGSGYRVLRGDARTISRDELYRKRSGLAINDEHKGPLIRREVTVIDLINKSESEEVFDDE